jgi:polar amino acid transport system substrate-binding protein
MNSGYMKSLLSPSGRLRAAINLGNPVLAQQGNDGELTGVSVALAHGIAERLNLPLDITCFSHAKQAFEAVAQDAVNIAFLAVDLSRAEQVAFSRPYLKIEGTYIVNRNSAVTHSQELDAPLVTIAASKGSAYGLHLERTLTQARLIEVATMDKAVEALLSRSLDAVAGIRQSLDQLAVQQPQLRVLSDPFMEIRQAICVPKRTEPAIELIDSIIEDMTTSGALAAALKASGQSASILSA